METLINAIIKLSDLSMTSIVGLSFVVVALYFTWRLPDILIDHRRTLEAQNKLIENNNTITKQSIDTLMAISTLISTLNNDITMHNVQAEQIQRDVNVLRNDVNMLRSDMKEVHSKMITRQDIDIIILQSKKVEK